VKEIQRFDFGKLETAFTHKAPDVSCESLCSSALYSVGQTTITIFAKAENLEFKFNEDHIGCQSELKGHASIDQRLLD
jgi:hypothetical protein